MPSHQLGELKGAARAQVWDLRKVEVALTLRGHTDTVTGLRVSPDGSHLLSNAMVRMRRALA